MVGRPHRLPCKPGLSVAVRDYPYLRRIFPHFPARLHIPLTYRPLILRCRAVALLPPNYYPEDDRTRLELEISNDY